MAFCARFARGMSHKRGGDYRAAESDLLIGAGRGWQAGVVGPAVSRADERAPQGRAFVTGEPSICNGLRKENQNELPSFYAEHGILSTVDVVIKGNDDRPKASTMSAMIRSAVTTSAILRKFSECRRRGE